MKIIKTRLFLLAAVLVFELAVHALAVAYPRHNDLPALLILFIAPGGVLSFLVGGGMSMVDGLSPDWRMSLALVLGFLLNTTLMFGFCLLIVIPVEGRLLQSTKSDYRQPDS